MKQSINFSQFTDAFRNHNRETNFSYDGLRALYDFIEQLDEECDTETELDVIALCCEFSEYGSLYRWADEHFAGDAWMDAVGIDIEEEEEDEETQNKAILDYLNNNTLVITFDSGIIIQDF